MISLLKSPWRLTFVVIIVSYAMPRIAHAGPVHCRGMVQIPAGPFAMGDSQGHGGLDERPAHTVHVSAFAMDRCEVTNAEMSDMLQWAMSKRLVVFNSNGVFNAAGDSRLLLDIHDWNSEIAFADGRFVVTEGREDYPCIEVTWHGAMAYCNFRSMREGVPISIDFNYWMCVFDRPGYRLPTEAEWEKAARGGLVGHVFPWPGEHENYHESFKPGLANAWKSGDPNEGVAGYTYTTPVGYYHAASNPRVGIYTNGYGLYDMAGNVEEWCWDLYDNAWYREDQASGRDCSGPVSGSGRVVRGGSWLSGQKREMKKAPKYTWRYGLRVAARESREAERGQHFRGFRCVRTVKE